MATPFPTRRSGGASGGAEPKKQRSGGGSVAAGEQRCAAMGGRRALALVQVPRVGDVPEAPRHKKVVHHPIKGVSHPASGARDGATFDEARSSKERRKEELGAQLRRARGEERELKRRLERVSAGLGEAGAPFKQRRSGGSRGESLERGSSLRESERGSRRESTRESTRESRRESAEFETPSFLRWIGMAGGHPR